MFTHNAEKKAAIDLKLSKRAGFEYNGVMVPATSEDAIGMLQLEAGFERMGMESSNFELSSGEVLPLTLAEWPDFKAAFFTFRASFYA